MQQRFDIQGMSCAACSARVEKAVQKVPGVRQAQVNLLTNSMQVDYDEQAASEDTIIAAVEHAGYHAAPAQTAARQEKGKEEKREVADAVVGMKKRVIWSFVFMIPLFYISMGHMANWPLPSILLGHENALIFAFVQFLLVLPIVALNHKYFSGGFSALIHGGPNMDSLIAIGSSAALLYGIYAIFKIGYGLGHGDMAMVHQFSMDLYFESAAMILTLISLGKYFETRAKKKTSEAIEKLMDLAPKVAEVKRGDAVVSIPVEQVQIGDVLIIRPGQGIPVDGKVVFGQSTVDESAITGESLPVEKKPGDHLTSGSINQTGYLELEALRVGENTTLSEMIRLVEEASASKAPIAKLADRVSGVFVPIVIGIAVVSFLAWMIAGEGFEFALSIGICVLVISCPCALGLATPTAIMVGTGKGAQSGILIKSAEALETLHKIDTMVLDKTGTITQGKPEVVEVAAKGMQEQNLIRIAASLEGKSEHPLADAVVRYAKKRGLDAEEVQGFDSVTGRGIRGRIGSEEYLVGNRAFLTEEGADCAELMDLEREGQSKGYTALYLAKGGKAQGLIFVADPIKESSHEAVRLLKEKGIDVVMLTGDNERTAAAIAKQAGIEHIKADVLPQQKQQVVKDLQAAGKQVAMVGDGINDAPALAQANVGIAIGAGTDIAMESADIVLTRSDLLDAVGAVELSRATIRNIKQNLFWALFYNTIGIPLAAGVLYPFFALKLSPMFGAAAMSLSSVCVVTNALRLRWFKPSFQRTQRVLPNAQEEPDEKIEQSIKQEEERTMKTMVIEGMSCQHCKKRVEDTLNAIAGVQNAVVDLEKKTATMEAEEGVSDAQLKSAVEDAGYEVVRIEG